MTHASLFSGIGGFDLAAQWAGWENLFNCEIDPFCQTVLKHHFPDAKQYADIRTTDFTPWRGRVDVLSGGFPCQPFSDAGKRKGTDDERHLWPEMLRAIQQIQPRWVVGENVLGIVNWSKGLVFEQVCADLETEATKSNRLYFQLTVSERHTGDTECGLLLKTPSVFDATVTSPKKNPVPGDSGSLAQEIMCGYVQKRGLLPTPVAWMDGIYADKHPENRNSKSIATLAEMGLLPTPQATDPKRGTKSDYQQSVSRTMGLTGSRLNPRFVAEMMGFPPDWTELPSWEKRNSLPEDGAKGPSKPTETPSSRR